MDSPKFIAGDRFERVTEAVLAILDGQNLLKEKSGELVLIKHHHAMWWSIKNIAPLVAAGRLFRAVQVTA